MTTVDRIHTHQSPCMPKEVTTTAFGVTLAAISDLAFQFLNSYASDRLQLPTLVKNFLYYGSGAGAIAGTVIAVYSAVRLCQKFISEKNEFNRTVTATALGVLAIAFTHTIAEHFWTIAPSFDYLEGYSVAYCIGTNLAWHLSAVTGVAAIVFTAYAAYRTGKALLSSQSERSS